MMMAKAPRLSQGSLELKGSSLSIFGQTAQGSESRCSSKHSGHRLVTSLNHTIWSDVVLHGGARHLCTSLQKGEKGGWTLLNLFGW